MQLQYNTFKKRMSKTYHVCTVFIFDQIFFWHTIIICCYFRFHKKWLNVIYRSTLYICSKDIVFYTMGKKGLLGNTKVALKWFG